MGAQVARTISSPAVIDYVDLGEDEALIEAEVPKDWVGKSLSDLHLSRESGLTILAVKPKGKSGTIPSGDTVLNEGDVIVVGGTKEALDRSPLVRPKGR
jgi:trk system potassium uptake protein TrkA